MAVQCNYEWNATTSHWDPLPGGCGPGFHCGQDPNVLRIVGQDGDMWITPCVADKAKPKAVSTMSKSGAKHKSKVRTKRRSGAKKRRAGRR